MLLDKSFGALLIEGMTRHSLTPPLEDGDMIGMSTGRRSALFAAAVLLAWAAVSPAIVEGQEAMVTGWVPGEGGGTPVVDVRVFVVGTALASTTNAEGNYTLRGV